MNAAVIISLFYLFLVMPTEFLLGQYPLYPQDRQHYINGSVGEERGVRRRYHYGVDMAAPNGTEVYAIEAGIFNKVGSNAVAIGRFCYVHVTDHPSSWRDGITWVESNQYIGKVIQGHVHLQESTEDLTDITGFEEQDGTPWINPIGHLNPFDTVAPNIGGVRLYRQSNNKGAHITDSLVLFGQIDIWVNVEDARIDTNGSGRGFGIAPYSINWEVLTLTGDVLHTYDGLSFANVPTNASARTVHGPNADWSVPNFEYWITNDAYNRPYDKYWNTLQHQGEAYNASASCPEKTLLPEGQRVRVRVKACDFSNNCDYRLLPSPSGNYVIDNFKPYLRRVTVKYGSTTVYDGVWECTNTCTNGLRFKEIVHKKLWVEEALNGLTIIAEGSEALSQLELRIPALGLNNLTASDISADQRIFTFVTGAITPAQFQYLADRALVFSGQDNNGNILMALQNFKSVACITIPTRRDNSVWSNPSSASFGDDMTHILPLCLPISFEANVVVHHPTDCNSADGLIRLLTTSGIQPPSVPPSYTYSIHWEDEYGNVLLPSGPFLLNLAPGSYCQVLTDPYGCRGEDCKGLTAQHYPEIYETVNPACLGGGNVGSIAVYAIDQSGGTYTFNWSTGHHTAFDYYSEITNLAPGTYIVTISSDVASCTLVRTYTVPTIQPPTPLYVSFTNLQPCPGQNNGQINLMVSGGIPPYIYAWSDAPPIGVTNTRSQLTAGDYIATVTDYCGTQVVISIPLIPMQVNSFTLIPACTNEGAGSIQIANGNAGYTHVWGTDPAQIGATVQNLRSGTICVTVTDNRGCSLIHCGELRNKEYKIVGENRPCQGFNDGSLNLKIYNPLSELVQITLDGQAQPLLDPFSTEIDHIVPNLSSGFSYSLVVTIGDCIYTYPFTMQYKAVRNVFDRYVDGVCYYDVYCGNNPVANDGYQQPPWMNFSDAEGAWLSKCRVNTYCGNIKVDKIEYSKKTVKAFVYYQILLDAMVNSPHSAEYIQRLIDHYHSKNPPYCSWIRYCPANLKITTTFPGLHGDAVNTSGNCWTLHCNLTLGDGHDFCLGQVVPNYFYSSPNPITPSPPPVYLCYPRTYSLFQLIMWKSDLLYTYPNFNGSELHSLITEWEATEPFDPRVYCAKVSFCMSDFKVLYSDVNLIDCSPCYSEDYVYSYGEPAPYPCSPYETSLQTTVYCQGTIYSTAGGSCRLFPVSLKHAFPGVLLIPPPNDEVAFIQTSHCLADRADKFINFGEAYSQGTFIPKGLFSGQRGEGLYYDYFRYNTLAEREIIPSVNLSFEDLDNGILVYVIKEDDVQYYLNYEDSLQDWSIPISANEFLDICHLSVESTYLVLAGRFKGALTFGDQVVANSTSINAFVLRVLKAGSLVSTQTVANFDASYPLVFERSGSDLLLSGRTGASALSIDEQPAIIGSQPGQYFTLREQISTSTYQYQANSLNTSSSIDLLKTAYSRLSGNRAYLFAGSGIIQVNSQIIAQPMAKQLTIVSLTPSGSPDWASTISLSSYDPAGLDLTESGDGGFFIGITFTDTLTVNNQLVIAEGGKDVAILKYRIDGTLASIKSFGSSDDEELKRCVFSEGYLYLGGNYYGLTFERIIGSNIFRSYPADSLYSKAYITFLPPETFEGSIARRSILNSFRKYRSFSNGNIKVYPNPFIDRVQVSVHSNAVAEYMIQLVNTLGVVVWQRKTSVTEGENLFTIDDLPLLPVGIYVLHVLSSDGQIYLFKMQKQ
ncbi:MAG: T9SS type A sorting domain-containing protein [candidate division WOR-3 bacterium]